MDKYVRVDWPESQEWMDPEFDDKGVFRMYNDYLTVFVPEELYKKVHSRRLPPDAHRCKNCEHCVKGKHSKGQWWELLVCAKQPKGDGLLKATSEYKGKDCEMFEPRKGE